MRCPANHSLTDLPNMVSMSPCVVKTLGHQSYDDLTGPTPACLLHGLHYSYFNNLDMNPLADRRRGHPTR